MCRNLRLFSQEQIKYIFQQLAIEIARLFIHGKETLLHDECFLLFLSSEFLVVNQKYL